MAFHGLSWLLLLQPMLSDEKPQAETGSSMTMNYKCYSFISLMTVTIDIKIENINFLFKNSKVE